MLVNILIRLCTLSLGLSFVVCTSPQQQSQLAALHERMNQMISALYSSPLLSKVKTSASIEETPTSSQETTYSYPTTPPPQVVYVSPPSFLEAGDQPSDYGYPSTTNPLPRAAWPYPYEISYQPQFAPPVYSPPIPRPSYPEYARAYPQSPAPQFASPPPPFPSPVSYASPFSSFPLPVCQPGYSVAHLLPSSYSQQVPYPPVSSPAPMPYPPSYPRSMPYPTSVPAPYHSPIPQQYAPSLLYPSPVPAPYPPMNSVQYSPTFSYPQPLFQHHSPPAFPKPSEILPQPQYEYSS